MHNQGTDPPEVRNLFELTSVNIGSWLASLSTDQLNDLPNAVDKCENMGLNDTIIKACSSFIQEMRRLKDTLQTINEQWVSKVASKPKGLPKVTFGT